MNEKAYFVEWKEKTKQKTSRAKAKGKFVVVSLIFSRTIITILLVLLQVFFLFATFQWFQNIPIITYILNGLGVLALIYIVNSNENPAFKLAWVIPICAFPVFGIAFYLFVTLNTGNYMLQKKLNRRIEETKPFLKPREKVLDQIRDEKNGALFGLAHYIRQYNYFPIYNRTSVEFFASGEEKFSDVLLELRQAKGYIFLEYFIINDGKIWQSILEILQQKVKQGVEVRVMYDGICAMASLPFHYPQYLQSMGIKAKMFAPIRPILSTAQNNRDHRKILIIDGKIAYNGGINLADEYANEKVRFGYWKDSAVKLTGDAVNSFVAMFLQMWNLSEDGSEAYSKYLKQQEKETDDFVTLTGDTLGYVLPFNDDPTNRMDIAKEIFLDMISRAEKYVYITTPYLIPDNELITAIRFAARRGVEIKIIMPHIPDKKVIFAIGRTYYPQFLEAGVQIYEYTPGFMHAKEMISDDKVAVVGTVNLDFRSLYLHFECGTYLYQNPVISDIKEDFLKTIEQCEKIDKRFCERLPLWYKVVGKIGRFVGPLM